MVWRVDFVSLYCALIIWLNYHSIHISTFSFLCTHQESSTFCWFAQTRNVSRNCELIFVPLVVHRQFFTSVDLPASEKADLVQSLALPRAAQIKRLNVGVTRVVNKTRFVPIEHTVKTERKEFSLVPCLDRLFKLILFLVVIHVEQIAQTLLVVETPTHVALLFGHNFTTVLTNERP